MASHVDEFLNPLFRGEDYAGLLEPNLSPPNILFWRGLYCRFESGVHPRESIADVMLATRLTKIVVISSYSNCLITLQFCSIQGTIRFRLNCTLRTCKSALQLFKLGCKSRNCDHWNRLMTMLPTLPIVWRITSDLPLKIISILWQTTCLRMTTVRAVLLHLFTFHLQGSYDERLTRLLSIGVRCATSKSESVPHPLITLARRSVQVFLSRFLKETICSCLSFFNYFQSHCWRCGEVFCTRCLDKSTPLPGHATHRPVPVCRSCYRETRLSSSSVTSN